MNAIKQVVPGDHADRDDDDRATRQPDQAGKCHHRRADGPDNLHGEEVEAEPECPPEPYERKFEHNQPEATREEKAADLAGAASARAVVDRPRRRRER